MQEKIPSQNTHGLIFFPSRHEVMRIVMHHAAATPPSSQHTDPQFNAAAALYK